VIGYRVNNLRNRRQGLTLVEVLLVLGLLVVIAALTLPALDKPFASVRLREAADQIRAEWATARVKAMESDEVYVFQYSLEGDRYIAVSYSMAVSFHDRSLGAAERAADIGAADPRPTERLLPQGVLFADCEIVEDTRSAAVYAGLEEAFALQRDWSMPVLFYPDGTTSTARLLLQNQHDRGVEVVLRGITGVVRVGDVMALEELLR
jgi:competence protein ComGC